MADLVRRVFAPGEVVKMFTTDDIERGDIIRSEFEDDGNGGWRRTSRVLVKAGTPFIPCDPELTDEMIEAGREALLRRVAVDDLRNADEGDIVTAVWNAMSAAKENG